MIEQTVWLCSHILQAHGQPECRVVLIYIAADTDTGLCAVVTVRICAISKDKVSESSTSLVESDDLGSLDCGSIFQCKDCLDCRLRTGNGRILRTDGSDSDSTQLVDCRIGIVGD